MDQVAAPPSMVMIIYHNEDVGTYIEIGDVELGKLRNVRPLGKKQLSEIIKLVDSKTELSGKLQAINRTVIAYQETPFVLAWLSESSDINIFVKNRQIIGKGLHFMFIIKDNKPHCFFVKKNRGIKTILYDTELPNVSNNGYICFGNNKMDTDSMEKAINSYEQIFFQTSFSNHSTKSINELLTLGVINRKTLKKNCRLNEFLNS